MPEPRYSSARPHTGDAAMHGHQTVSAVVPVPEPDVVPGEPPRGPDRIDEYETVAPDGSTVVVRHNLETGETTVVE